jgi:hypothetical protein
MLSSEIDRLEQKTLMVAVTFRFASADAVVGHQDELAEQTNPFHYRFLLVAKLC